MKKVITLQFFLFNFLFFNTLVLNADISFKQVYFNNYKSVFDQTVITLFPEENQIIYRDISEVAKFFSKQDKYFCVKSSLINFSVPKIEVGETSEWRVNEINYANRGTMLFDFLGINTPVIKIESQQDNLKYLYYYSIENGLLSFEVEGHIEGKYIRNSYFSVKKIGFGNATQ